jgi:hypothetical protein
MAKLKLTALSDEKPVKVAVELPAPLHRDLYDFVAASADHRHSRSAQAVNRKPKYHRLKQM